MNNFEKKHNQKEVYHNSFLKKQLFSGTVSIRLFEFGFFGQVASKQNFPNKKHGKVIQSTEQKNQNPSLYQNSKFKTNIIKKKLLNGYSKIHELKLVTIELASPEKIQSWAEKELPNGKIFGEVTNANTFHYRTFKPSKGGLFCERIFGPIKDFECACGKRQRPTAIESKRILEHEQTSRSFCPNCDVEYTWSIIRRYQLGYIKLNAPVAHLWYFKSNPSYLSILFDMKRKHLESIIYCTEKITIENTWKYSLQHSNFNRSPKDLYLTWQKLLKMEEKLQKYQRIYENKQEKQKQNKIVFRNLCLNEKKVSPQINWQNFDRTKFLKSMNNFESFEEVSGTSNVAKNDILLNISKQKQKKFVVFLFKEIWKKFLEKSYKNAVFFTYSQEFLSNQFFQNLSTIFNIFLFSSKKSKKFSSFSDLVFDFEKQSTVFLYTKKPTSPTKTLKKQILLKNSFLDENKNQNRNQNNFEENRKTKKKYWKSLFFLFEFANFFLQQKNKKIKFFESISKKDFVFLINLLPFLKQIFIFKNLKFLKKNNKTIHSFLVQNLFVESKSSALQLSHKQTNNSVFCFYPSKKPTLLAKNKFFKKLNAVDKTFFYEKSLFQYQNPFQKIKPFFSESNFGPLHLFFQEKFKPQNKKIFETNIPVKEEFSESIFLSPAKRKNTNVQNKICLASPSPTKESNSLFNPVLNMSATFHKFLAFLKSYYEVDFAFVFQNKFFNSFGVQKKDEKNFFLEKNLNKSELDIFLEQSFEVFLNESQFFCIYKKVCFDSFSFFLYFFGADRIVQNTFFCEFFENKNSFSSRNFQHFVFLSLKFLPSLFFLFSDSESRLNKKGSLPLFLFEKQGVLAKHAKKSTPPEGGANNNLQKVKKAKLYISNKPFLSRVKFNENKKERRNNQIQKLFQVDSFSDDFQSNFHFQRKNKKVFLLPQKNLLRSVKKHTLLSTDMYFENIQFFNQKKTKSQKNDIFKSKIQKKYQTNQKSHFLKNRISTLAYNYPWNNDADWKYFVYYNSLFLYEFEDSPIFIYRSLFPGTTNNQAFLMSDANSMFTKFNESFLSWSIDDSFPNNFFVGAGIIEKLLTEYTSLELRKMTKQHQILLPKMNQMLRLLKQNAKTKKDVLKIQKYFQKREHIIRRLKFLRKFSRRNSNPTFMILRNLPVLPPDLRPILKLQNQIAASDLNRFYQRIIYRNERLKKFSKDSATNQSFEIQYAQRLLQEAVDNLIQNGKGSVKAETNSRGQPLKSLSEILKGKQGRFRQYLLGKRVDYSGRSVIVVGPELKLYECGLPREMALELFLPFLIQYVLHNKLAKTVIGAKNLLKSDKTLSLHLLNKVMKNIPVLLNRAPTLHRLGFQAFLPKLIEGRAILLHPMVCPAFNADFDGDQMAVHIPLTVEARTEAWKFMLSTNNLMNSATGEAIILPSQDMVLGCYYLTLDFQNKFVGVQIKNSLKKTSLKKQSFQKFILQNKSFLFFKNFHSVLTAYQKKQISLHTPVWVKWNAAVDFGNEFSKPVEIRLQIDGSWEEIQPKYTTFYNQQNKPLYKRIRTTAGRILMNFMIQECSKDF